MTSTTTTTTPDLPQPWQRDDHHADTALAVFPQLGLRLYAQLQWHPQYPGSRQLRVELRQLQPFRGDSGVTPSLSVPLSLDVSRDRDGDWRVMADYPDVGRCGLAHPSPSATLGQALDSMGDNARDVLAYPDSRTQDQLYGARVLAWQLLPNATQPATVDLLAHALSGLWTYVAVNQGPADWRDVPTDQRLTDDQVRDCWAHHAARLAADGAVTPTLLAVNLGYGPGWTRASLQARADYLGSAWASAQRLAETAGDPRPDWQRTSSVRVLHVSDHPDVGDDLHGLDVLPGLDETGSVVVMGQRVLGVYSMGDQPDLYARGLTRDGRDAADRAASAAVDLLQLSYATTGDLFTTPDA